MEYLTQEEKQQALADALQMRQQMMLGQVAQLAGGRTLPKLGQSMLTGGLEASKLLEHRQRAMMDARRQEEAGKIAAQERAADNDRAERGLKLSAERFAWEKDHPPMQFMPTPQGIVAVNPKNPTAPPSLVPAPSGTGPLQKLSELSTDDKKRLGLLSQDVAGISELRAGFKPEYVGGGSLAGEASRMVDRVGGGGGVMGEVAGAFSKAAGGPDSEGIKARANWWRRYEALVNLPERNEVFGSSLSESERASWADAAAVARGSDPEAARKALAWLESKAKEKLSGLSGSVLAEGASPSAVSALTAPALRAQPDAAVPGADEKALNWARNNKGDKRAKAIFERLGVSE